MTSSEERSARSAHRANVIAGLALAVTVVASILGYRRLDEQDDRLKEQEEEQYATDVYIGEAPQYVRTYESDAKWAVVNGSDSPLHHVWIADENGAAIEIDGVEPCVAYSAPSGFEAVGVHFRDTENVDWFRPVNGPLTHDYQEREGGFDNLDDDAGEPGGPYPIDGCA